MPELPEMETYRKLLEERVGGMVITEARVEREKTINVPPQMFIQTVTGIACSMSADGESIYCWS